MDETAQTDSSLRIVQPSSALRPYISAYYLFEINSLDPISDLSVPEWGCVRLIHAGGFAVETGSDTGRVINQSVIQGPSSKAVGFTVQRCAMLGIGLLPAGYAKFWDNDVGRIADKSVPWESVVGVAAEPMLDAVTNAETTKEKFSIVDSFFLGMLLKTSSRDASDDVTRVHALLNDPAISDIEQLAEAMGRHPSALARFCKRRFGFAPKLLLRRQRFLRMLDGFQSRPYAEWPDFLDPQYTDQSHMIRDFHYFMGMSPTHYLALPRLVQKASAAHRTEALGGALQGLA